MSNGVLTDGEANRQFLREHSRGTNLSGHVALVTGCSGRLGRLWVQALKDAGAPIVIGTDTADALRGDSPFKGCDCFVADLSDVGQVSDLAHQVCGTYGPPTILVNNAGVDDRPRTGVLNGPRYDVAASMADVNLLGTYRMLQTFGPRMAERGEGSIINIASLYGLCSPDMRYYGDSGFEKHAMYGATKAGIVSLTKYYAAYWGPRGVRVNALAPGGVVDPNDPLTGKDDTFKRNYTARIPMGRMCQPSDLSGPLVFLASKASSFVTGHTIPVDGGFLAW